MRDRYSMKIKGPNGKTITTSRPCGNGVSMVYNAKYVEGDSITLEVGADYGHYFIKFDDALPEVLVYIPQRDLGGVLKFFVPGERELVCFSPKSFAGDMHVISARKASAEELKVSKNLALNPYDGSKNDTFFPHATANVETRNEAVFEARNAIDGCFENASHGKFPYTSWGINRNPEAAHTIDFGRDVEVSEIRITLRADYPHDNYWTQGDVIFSDGTTETLKFTKTAEAQCFPIEKRVIRTVVFTNLIQSDEASPFPALTQIEVIGVEA
ncbi:MAG: carbohydrate-binding protein [Clostridia bacterium]